MMINKTIFFSEIDKLSKELPEAHCISDLAFNRGYVRALLDVLYVLDDLDN